MTCCIFLNALPHTVQHTSQRLARVDNSVEHIILACKGRSFWRIVTCFFSHYVGFLECSFLWEATGRDDIPQWCVYASQPVVTYRTAYSQRTWCCFNVTALTLCQLEHPCQGIASVENQKHCLCKFENEELKFRIALCINLGQKSVFFVWLFTSIVFFFWSWNFTVSCNTFATLFLSRD